MEEDIQLKVSVLEGKKVESFHNRSFINSDFSKDSDICISKINAGK